MKKMLMMFAGCMFITGVAFHASAQTEINKEVKEPSAVSKGTNDAGKGKAEKPAVRKMKGKKAQVSHAKSEERKPRVHSVKASKRK